ncbi:MAG TPA: Fe-S cluster assembly ATPase SufC [Candidatus Babeliales bacterium]|nr:Fe-S cluster assembly ATPase SufC [Candidatus Babeliales bacterium]
MPDQGLRIADLRCRVAGNEILKGIDLTVEPGLVHALMGPNGSGKSTLAFSLTGHPHYEVTGTVELDGEDLLSLTPDKRARAGLFLSFQYPASIPGVRVANFLHAARQAEKSGDLPPAKFRALLLEKMDQLGIDPSFMGRYLNDGFSGGEKKRLEMLQLAVLAPKYAIMDETDSGLDIDALKDVGNCIAALRESSEGSAMGLLIITHYPRILQYVIPDVVHVMIDGRIVETGGPDLAHRIEREGYDKLREQAAAAALGTGAAV